MAALMLAIGLDIYLVAIMIVDDATPAAMLAAAVGSLLAWLWFATPSFARLREQRSRDG